MPCPVVIEPAKNLGSTPRLGALDFLAFIGVSLICGVAVVAALIAILVFAICVFVIAAAALALTVVFSAIVAAAAIFVVIRLLARVALLFALVREFSLSFGRCEPDRWNRHPRAIRVPAFDRVAPGPPRVWRNSATRPWSRALEFTTNLRAARPPPKSIARWRSSRHRHRRPRTA